MTTHRSTPSETVVRRVASLEGVEPTALEPLFETIDPEALDSMVSSTKTVDIRIDFSYHGHEISVAGDGEVLIATPETIVH